MEGYHHPDCDALESFSRGGSSAVEERWIEDHLRSGCAVCQLEVDALLLRALGPAVAGGWDSLVAGLERRLAGVAAERREAPERVAELLACAPAERRDLLGGAGRFHTFAVCELLIDRSWEERFGNAARCVELAELGLAVARRLDAERYGRSIVFDLQARAWAYLGNARRLARDLAGAEQALDQAERLAENGSADPLEEARILELRASLLSDQGRCEQAAGLLDEAVDIYESLREPHRKGRVLITKGLVLGYTRWHEEAIRTLRSGLGLIDREEDPRLALMARHNLAWFLSAPRFPHSR